MSSRRRFEELNRDPYTIGTASLLNERKFALKLTTREGAAGSIHAPIPPYVLSVTSGTPSDSSATEKIRDGDHDAFAAIFRALYPNLCAAVSRRVGSRETAEELVQEVFLRVWQHRSSLDPTKSITSYLYRAAKNQALNHIKHREIASRSRDLLVLDLHERQERTGDSAQFEEVASAAAEAIDHLPARCREIFLLSRHAELTYGEIARLLGISVKTVETQMGRALKTLRTRLRPFLGSD